MPITAELENVKKLESAGFSHVQAVVLSEIQETTAHDSVKELKDFIHSELKELRSEINGKIDNLELRIKASQADLLVKIFGLLVGCFTISFIILKLTS